ncbi:MAG: HNH endonuclease [Bacillaceae bacterium]
MKKIKVVDMTNKIIHNWKVIRRDELRKGAAYWICECQCENKTVKSVSGINLRAGNSKSCGCIHDKHYENQYDLSSSYGVGYTNKGEKFYFDKEDYKIIVPYYWFITSRGYPCTRRNNKDIFMHRLILNAREEVYIDHINHIEYDNRKENLRLVSHGENMLNKNKYKNNSSGYPGVNWHKRSQKWIARISINKKQTELGRFNSKEEAIAVRKAAEEKYYGEYRNKYV